MVKRYTVTLSAEEREALHCLIHSRTHRARKITHARILLKADEGWSDQQISRALDVSIPIIERVRQRFVLEGLEAALNQRSSAREYRRKLDGEGEAHLIALVCGEPPEGRARWSLRLLADQLEEVKYIDSASHETVRRVLNDNELKPWLKKEWCIPPEANAEFVYHMEDVLDVYQRPADPTRRRTWPASASSRPHPTRRSRPWPGSCWRSVGCTRSEGTGFVFWHGSG